MNTELLDVAKSINEVLDKKREQLRLSFVEKKHIYYMADTDGNIKSNFPSVSKIIKKFHDEFDANGISLRLAKGDKEEQKKLLQEWALAGKESINLGSRVHYELEKHLIAEYGDYKKIRKPIFSIDDEQERRSDNMIAAGKNFLELMKERGAVLLDTELIMGSNRLGYVGQCDNAWLMPNKNKDNLCIVITDYKTNKEKNFEVAFYNGKLYPPFNDYRDYALTHYYLQIPFYGRLLMDMLKGSVYENVTYCGGVVVLLKDNKEFVEFRVPKDMNDKVFKLQKNQYL